MKTILAFLFLLMSHSLFAQALIDFDRIIDKDKSILMKGSFSIKNLKEANYTWYKKNYDAAKFKEDAINQLKGRLNDFQVVIFLGTWCSDSHTLIPPFIKLLELINYPPDRILCYGVDRKKETKGIEHRLYHIERVPTIILMRDNVEMGRITESVEKNIETSILQLLEKI
ncbi:MAG: thioredoxin family protein [Bacteroidota bacterium]|nr:thioredoxin family protein [Bacteroidota bacterium]